MGWHACHNGKRIPYWLGVVLALDQFAGALWPGADIDETIMLRGNSVALGCRVAERLADG